MSIVKIKSKKKWNEFVENSNHAFFSHLYEWMEIWRDSLGYKMLPLAKIKNEKIVDIFPLIYDSKNKTLESHTWGGFGGPLTEKYCEEFLKYINNIAKNKKVQKIEIRPIFNLNFKRYFKKHGFNTSLLTTNYKLDLAPDESFEQILMAKIKNRKRNSYRSSMKKILIKSPSINLKNVRLIYKFYKSVMNYHKEKKVLPIVVFDQIFYKMHDRISLLLAVYENKKIGGAIIIKFKNINYDWFIVSSPKHRWTGVNNALYGEFIRCAVVENAKSVDFGPSLPFSPAKEIKAGFGGEPQTQIRAIKTKGLKENLNLIYKGAAFKFCNKFPKVGYNLIKFLSK